MAGAADKAVIMIKVTPSEFDLLRESVKAERERAFSATRDNALAPGSRSEARERTVLLDGLLAKIT